MGFSLFVNRLPHNWRWAASLRSRGMAHNWRKYLKQAIEARGTHMKEVSLKAGLNATLISEWINKGKDPTITSLAKVLEFLNLSYDELMTGVIPTVSPKSVDVVGETAAGLWLEPDSWDEAKYPPVPFVPTRYAQFEQRAYKVVGPSMNAAGLMDGSFVITVAYWDARTQPQDGDYVVVERRRDGGLVERTLKEVVVFPDRIELTPRSTDPRFQEPIVVPREVPRAEEPLEVEIVALVIGSYSPVGR